MEQTARRPFPADGEGTAQTSPGYGKRRQPAETAVEHVDAGLDADSIDQHPDPDSQPEPDPA